ncbi:hypothetical protein CDAR_238131 [Caerostris darwini]|uniref:Uncharacterized protein n=1 Tax=Caerostris darwini TaxID=1538125 RepID=A0AAV4TNP6_9ARAC|nr:hypothetical protein CDAR_238131 [Caerostris darwini]
MGSVRRCVPSECLYVIVEVLQAGSASVIQLPLARAVHLHQESTAYWTFAIAANSEALFGEIGVFFAVIRISQKPVARDTDERVSYIRRIHG